jgi:hypothetical protein
VGICVVCCSIDIVVRDDFGFVSVNPLFPWCWLNSVVCVEFCVICCSIDGVVWQNFSSIIVNPSLIWCPSDGIICVGIRVVGSSVDAVDRIVIVCLVLFTVAFGFVVVDASSLSFTTHVL